MPGSSTVNMVASLGEWAAQWCIASGCHVGVNLFELRGGDLCELQVLAGGKEKWRLCLRMKERERRAADQPPSAGTCDGVDPGLRSGDAHRTSGNALAGDSSRGVARRGFMPPR